MTSLSSRADAGTGRASRGMARTHAAILTGLVDPRNHPRLSQTRHQNPAPAPPHLDGVRQPTWCGPLPRPTGRAAAPRTDSLWKGSRGGVSASLGPRCTCRPRPRQGCRASLRDGRDRPRAGNLRPSRRPPTAAPSQRGHRPLRGAEGGHRPAPRIGDDHAEHSLCRMGGGPMSVAVAPADPGGHASGADPFVRAGRSATRRWRTSRTCRMRRSPRSGRYWPVETWWTPRRW